MLFCTLSLFNLQQKTRGVTTDLWDGGGGRGRNNGKTLLTRGHNWSFSCLDLNIFEQVLDLSKKGGGHPPTHHPPQGRILTTFRLFLLQGADNEGGFWLISAFFLLQGAGD